MLPSSPFWRGGVIAACVFALAISGFPLAFALTHGLNPRAWPPSLDMTPGNWLDALLRGSLMPLISTYWQMAQGTCDSLPGGGYPALVTLVIMAVAGGAIMFIRDETVPARDPSNVYGSTDWATRRARRKLSKGLEIGLDPDDRRPIRIQVEKNLLTIAPPRSGKTAGFIIPNLAKPDDDAWDGPAVVIDPKGDAYRAVERRRKQLGRTVRCIDPLGLVGGMDKWNPLAKGDPKDVLYLQAMARALLPNTAATDTSAFFTNNAVDYLVGALIASITKGRPSPTEAARLLLNPKELYDVLELRSDAAAMAALAIRDLDEKTRSNIEATATQASQWLRDERMQAVVNDHTFQLADLAGGDVDLFVVLPGDDRKDIIAPFVRWLLADLFAMARSHRLQRRLVVFIDEAKVLGAFDAVLNGQGELPGYGISLWTIWQTRSQIREVYGADGAKTFFGNAEMVNVFDIPRQDTEETEYWSQSIGEFTAAKPTTGRDGQTGRPTTTMTAEAQRLVPATDIPTFLERWQVAFLSGSGYTRNPVKLRRTKAFSDLRFNGLIKNIPPVGPSGS